MWLQMNIVVEHIISVCGSIQISAPTKKQNAFRRNSNVWSENKLHTQCGMRSLNKHDLELLVSKYTD